MELESHLECWTHTSQQHIILSHLTLRDDTVYTSDHMPSLIDIQLSIPIFNPEKINWKKLKLSNYRKKFKKKLQHLLKVHQYTLLDPNNMILIDSTFEKCQFAAGKSILGVIPTHPHSPYHSSTLECINKKLKGLLRKSRRCELAARKRILQQSIKTLRKQFNQQVEKEVYQKQLDIKCWPGYKHTVLTGFDNTIVH